MKKLAKRYLSILLTFILCLGVFVPDAMAASAISTHRISGDTRYTTAANIATEGWSDGSQWAIIACGSNFPDALASTPLATKYNAPILLTERDSLTAVTKSTLSMLGTKNVYIVGGTGAVSTAVETQLKSMGILVTRLSGSDRYNTSVEIAKSIGNTSGMLIVAPGDDYPNALSISSYAGIKQIPIILVDKNTISDSLKQYLANSSIQQTYVIGNTTEISDSIVNTLPNPKRIQGTDRYATNLAVLKAFEHEYTFTNTFIATGNNFADALAGSSYAAKLRSPIILTGKTADSRINNYLSALSSSITQLNILGGESAIASSLVNNYLGIGTSTLTAAEIFAQIGPSVVYIETYDNNGNSVGSGSGFIVDSNGKIVTNYHVIEGAYRAKVKTASGTSYNVEKVLSYNEMNDLIVLKVSAIGLPAVSLGDSGLIETGNNIYAIGNPLGLESTISNGLVSTKSRDIDGTNYIQISAPISSGSSGGALVDDQGKVIGITAAVYYGGQNLNFAVPVNLLKPLLTENIDKTLPGILPAVYGEYLLGLSSYIQSTYGTNIIAGQTVKYTVYVVPYEGEDDTSHDGSAFILFTVTPETDEAESNVLDNSPIAYNYWLAGMLDDLQSKYGTHEFCGGMYYYDSVYVLFDNWSGEIEYYIY